jgi:hypothetical protein
MPLRPRLEPCARGRKISFACSGTRPPLDPARGSGRVWVRLSHGLLELLQLLLRHHPDAVLGHLDRGNAHWQRSRGGQNRDLNTVVSVDYATANASATAGQHYAETKGTLAFAPGESVKTVTVPILYREQAEPNKSFWLTLSNPSAGVVRGTNSTATITILDTTGTAPHQFDGLTLRPDGSAQLTLGGSVHKRFVPYFDLYPIEVSTDLVHWEPLITLMRTNSSTNVLAFSDPGTAQSDRPFYRTPASHFIAPLTNLRARHGIGDDTPIRVIETRNGILLVPLTNEPMSPALAQELAEWQSLAATSWELLDYQQDAP